MIKKCPPNSSGYIGGLDVEFNFERACDLVSIHKDPSPVKFDLGDGVCLGGLYVNPYRDYTATLQEYL